MKKLKLNLDEIKVESFETNTPSSQINGTIRAQADTDPDPNILPVCFELTPSIYGFTCLNECTAGRLNEDSCIATCSPTCDTCYDTCGAGDTGCNFTDCCS